MRWTLALALALASGCAPEPEDIGDTQAPDDTSTPEDTGEEPFEGPPEVLLPQLGLQPDQLAVVVNSDDPLSADIAAAWAEARGVPAEAIVPLALGTAAQLDEATFEAAKAELDLALGPEVQALVLAFTTPYQVSCMGTAAAFALGFDEGYCATGCVATTASSYFDSDSVAPYTDHGLRPAMMLSADSLAEAQALIDRGLAADDTNPPGQGFLVRTTDSARSVRYTDFERTLKRVDPEALELTYVDNADGGGSDLIEGEQDLIFYLTGLTRVDGIDSNTFRPGALADHLTSYGGVLSDTNGQMPATEWLEGGATASYGTAHEPCNFPQKFPQAEVLISRYFRGATALEAYWKSVEWPGQGNFVGEPLARPWSPGWTWEEGTLTISTTSLDRYGVYLVEAADSADGPWEEVAAGEGPQRTWTRVEIVVEEAWRPFYRFSEVD